MRSLKENSKKLQPTTENKVQKRYKSPRLPLAVYREVAAHLRQVTGVDAGLITKPLQGSTETFDYYASQIECLWLEYPDNLPTNSKQQIQAILDYYGKRYQCWEMITSF